jgi:GNAT superfamily N-acetyltransferase
METGIVEIRQAQIRDCEVVAHLVHDLLTELTFPEAVDFSVLDCADTTRRLLGGSAVWAFLAELAPGDAVGVLTLNECAAIYAGGTFGEISELYVRPPFRSKGVGNRLVHAAIEFGQSREWKRLEVCAPPVPAWERTVGFYCQNGFAQLGPRLKLPLSTIPAARA